MPDSKQYNDAKLLYKAIQKEDKETVEKLVDNNNVNINIPNANGNPPLYWAILKKNADIMKLLISKGADLHARNQDNLRPLDIAIQNDNLEAALLLIRREALVGEDLTTFLLKAIESNNQAIVPILITNGLQYNPLIDFKYSLNAAISRRLPKIIEHILPYCRFSQPSEKYIPRELVIKHEPQNKECLEVLLNWHFTVNPTSNEDTDFVYAAVEKGYILIVEQLLKLGIDVNLVNLSTNYSLLKLACMKKYYKIANYLLKYNAAVNVTIPTDSRILNKYLCNDINKNSEMFPSLFNEQDLWDATCLYIAAVNSDSVIVKFLLDKGTFMIDDPKLFNNVCIAVQNNCEEILCMFLERGINVNDIDSEGKSLLHYCVDNDGNKYDVKYNITQLLLERGATNHLQTPGNSLIFEAIKNGHRRIAQLFLDYDANIEYTSPDGDTPLHKAIDNYFDTKFIESLLKLNAPVDAVNHVMFTPLLAACRSTVIDQLEVIKILLQYNANVNCNNGSANVNSHSPLPHLVQDINKYTRLPKKKLNLNRSEKIKGQTPLHLVCKYKTDQTVNIIELLLKHNADIEAMDAEGWTPLFVACYSNNNTAVKCLLDNNANINHVDNQNLNALYITVEYNRYNSEVVELLLEYKVNINCIDKQRNSIIHVIAENNNAEIVKRLYHTQINFNYVNNEHDTPLHVAVKNKGINVVKSLIKYGANINVLDGKKLTALRHAIKFMSIYRKKLEDNRLRRDSCRFHRFSRCSSKRVGFSIYRQIHDLYIYQDMIKLLKRQVVKLKVAGLKVNEQNIKIVYRPNDYHDYDLIDQDKLDCAINVEKLEESCEQEIEKMKTENINVCNITLYNLLTKNIHFLNRFVKNLKIKQALERDVYDREFPLYIDIVRNRFREANFFHKLVECVKAYFQLHIYPRLSDDCTDILFSYLNIQDMKVFFKAIKPLDEDEDMNIQ